MLSVMVFLDPELSLDQVIIKFGFLPVVSFDRSVVLTEDGHSN